MKPITEPYYTIGTGNGNDDCYISTYLDDWQEFVKQKLKEETK